MATAFENLGLNPSIMQAIETMGYKQPTPIQESAIPHLLEGRDVVGQAQTGTGKTAAFVLPMLQHIQPGAKIVQGLVLAPTRELAIQVAEAATRMAQNTPTRVLAVYGGQSYDIQKRQLARGVDIVVGTPGRLLDLIRQNVLDLSHVSYMVLDEADEMLEMGFIEDVETILSQLPTERQMALFSATMPEAVRKLAEKYLNDPQAINMAPATRTVAETEQRYCRVREENKLEALTRLLEVEPVRSALIFARTKAKAQELADELIRRGYPAQSLHGDLSQSRREYVLNSFREGRVTLLVATDVAARGLDIQDVSHVFNFDVPGDAEDYVHRIGRTGRAGRKGVAITFFHPRDRVRRKQIEAYTRQEMVEMPLPTRVEMQGRRDERFIQRVYEQILFSSKGSERDVIEQLVANGLDIVDIAAAAIQMARAGESPLPENDIIEPHNEKQGRLKRRAEREARETAGTGEPRQAGGYESRRKPRAEGSWSEGPRGENGRQNGDRANNSAWKDGAQAPRRSRREQTQETGYVRLRMNMGETHGLRPGDVVGAIASEVGIPGRAIGQIDIHRNHTFVDVSEKHVRQVLRESNGQYHLRGIPVMLTLAS